MTPRAHAVVIALTLVALVFIIRLVRSRRLKAKYSLLWLSLGSALLAMSIVPGLLDQLAERLGIYYQPGLYLFLGLVFLLLVVVHFSYELSRMENRIRILAEEVTLLRHRVDRPVDGSAASPVDASVDEAAEHAHPRPADPVDPSEDPPGAPTRGEPYGADVPGPGSRR